MRRILGAAVLVLGLACAHVANAQGTSASPVPAAHSNVTSATAPADTPATAIDPAKKADIEKLLEATGAKALARQAMDGMMTSMTSLLRSNFQQTCAGDEKCVQFGELVTTKLQQKVDGSVDVLMTTLIPIYDRHYSKEDIEGLIQFYQSPLGQKLAKNLPEIARESQQVGSQLGQNLGRESVQEVLQEHPELRPGGGAAPAAGKSQLPSAPAH